MVQFLFLLASISKYCCQFDLVFKRHCVLHVHVVLVLVTMTFSRSIPIFNFVFPLFSIFVSFL